MQKNNIQITTRDLEILQFINDCGFCEIPQIEKRFNLKKPRSYQVMKRLISAKLVKHQRVLYGRHGIYMLNKRGAKHTTLPPLDKIILNNYDHTVWLTDLYIKLRQVYPDAVLFSERHLLKEKFTTGVGKPGHMSDGMLRLADGKQIALEVELTLKSKSRLESILKSYASQFNTQEIWYFCHDRLVPIINAMIEKMPFIKVHSLKEFLAHE